MMLKYCSITPKLLLIALLHQCISHALENEWEVLSDYFTPSFGGRGTEISQNGFSECPCIDQKHPTINPLNESDLDKAFFGDVPTIDLSTYGFGCKAHDISIPTCLNGCLGSYNVLPPTIDCDVSWCYRKFCWVDPSNCRLLNRPSYFLPDSNRFYSYATCGDMDMFSQNKRLSSLRGKVLRAGFNSNTGGWIGAYGEEYKADPDRNETDVAMGEHFLGPISRWSGPIVNFVTRAARAGNFYINITVPPSFLLSHAQRQMGTTSPFDFCVYATSLGYLDLCIAQYTVTNKRASITDWMILSNQDVHLITKMEPDLNGWELFCNQATTIFQPFTMNTWLFIIFVVIPVLGGLMVVHEYGHAGSTFPKQESIVEINKQDGAEYEIKERNVPICHHLTRSFYVAYLAVLQQDYSQSVVTYGAMVNLLGISFFILTIIAVYTANLAAILSQKPPNDKISGLDEVARLKLKICIERTNLNVLKSIYPDIPDSLFVNDPEYLGGDGKPGFTCPLCYGRSRVFAMINSPDAVSKNDSYCHVAIAPLEDLQVEKQVGKFCSLEASKAGAIAQIQRGMPVFEGVSSELVSLLMKLKNEGAMDKELAASRPNSQCLVEVRGEGSPLSISQLTGIWVVSFGFALIGLIVTFVSPIIRRCRRKRIQTVIGYDQSGNRINMMEQDDEALIDPMAFKSEVGPVHISFSSGSANSLRDDLLDAPGKSYTTKLNDSFNPRSSGELEFEPLSPGLGNRSPNPMY